MNEETWKDGETLEQAMEGRHGAQVHTTTRARHGANGQADGLVELRSRRAGIFPPAVDLTLWSMQALCVVRCTRSAAPHRALPVL